MSNRCGATARSTRSPAEVEMVFDALGEPTRRRIVELLGGGPVRVGDIAASLPVGRPAVSRHLRVLTDAGLVEHSAQGTRHLYALAPAGLAVAQQWLVRTWDTVRGAYAAEVERVAENLRSQEGK